MNVPLWVYIISTFVLALAALFSSFFAWRSYVTTKKSYLIDFKTYRAFLIFNMLRNLESNAESLTPEQRKLIDDLGQLMRRWIPEEAGEIFRTLFGLQLNQPPGEQEPFYTWFNRMYLRGQ